MTTDEMLDYILTLIETYDPLYEHTHDEPAWIDADPLEKEVSMTVRTLWNEINMDMEQLLGPKGPTKH